MTLDFNIRFDDGKLGGRYGDLMKAFGTSRIGHQDTTVHIRRAPIDFLQVQQILEGLYGKGSVSRPRQETGQELPVILIHTQPETP